MAAANWVGGASVKRSGEVLSERSSARSAKRHRECAPGSIAHDPIPRDSRRGHRRDGGTPSTRALARGDRAGARRATPSRRGTSGGSWRSTLPHRRLPHGPLARPRRDGVDLERELGGAHLLCLHLAHFLARAHEPGRIPHLADPGKDLAFLLTDVGLEARVNLLHLRQPLLVLGTMPLDLLHQPLELLHLGLMLLPPAG